MKKRGVLKLGQLSKGEHAHITSVDCNSNDQCMPQGFIQRFMEMGFVEGSVVEVVHEAPFSGDPIAVRIRGALIALRRNEANSISVDVLGEM
ncbi:MAG: FeoA family protein [Bdellovibrionota bacterium]